MCVVHAVNRLLALHGALRLWAHLWLLAFPLALGLCTDVLARLVCCIALALHLTNWLAALGLAMIGTVAPGATARWTHNLAIWLATFHFATLGVEALAPCRAQCLIALGSAHLVALSITTFPFALWGATAAATLNRGATAIAFPLLLGTPRLPIPTA